VIRLNCLQLTDVQKLVAAIKLMRQLFHNSAFDEFRGEEIAPGADVTSDKALVAYIRDWQAFGIRSALAKWALTQWQL